MQFFRKQIIATLSAALLALATVMPATVYAAEVEETPSAGAMVGDLLIARPLLLVTTVAGTAVYLVSLPFTLLGGNAGEAAEVLVLDPAAATFTRCLGCENTNRDTSDVDDSDYQASNSGGYDLSDAVVSDEEIYPVYRAERYKPLGLNLNVGVSTNRSFGVDNSTGYQLGVGYRLLDGSWGFVDADLTYFSTGVVEEPGPNDGVLATFATGAEYETTGLLYGGKFGLKIGRSFSTYAKYGRSKWDIELRRDGDNINTADGTGSYYGIGFGYDISKSVAASIEYTDFDYKKDLYRYDNEITSYVAKLAVKF